MRENEFTHKRKTLAVIGAGPKGIAVAVKAKVLSEFGLPVDRVVLIERHSVGAHWSGEAGYTNGEMKLGTSPDKDVVFPLETAVADSLLSMKIRQRLMHFTWSSFLVETGRLSDWIDRGRPAPSHGLWALYLKWVSANLGPEIEIIKAEVSQVELLEKADVWKLTLRSSSGERKLHAERLMFTGPGKTRMDIPGQGADLPAGVFDLESFWSAIKKETFDPRGRVAVVGTGENAASALLALSKFPELQIDVISPRGFLSTRAENFYENQVYSQPDRYQWKNLELKDRIDFIERTDLGVFSTHAMQILNGEVRHRVVPGRMVDLKLFGSGLGMVVEYAGQKKPLAYEQVILATGFDYVKTIKSVFSEQTLKRIETSLGAPLTQALLSQRIREDLSVEGLEARLHLPMLAGLMQGPGFANLSCLGRLSDRIVLNPQLEAHRQLETEFKETQITEAAS